MPYADVISYLDQHEGAVTAFLTAALVIITAIYTWQNRRIVREMESATAGAILPKLALEFHRLGPTVVSLAIRNVGQGAALDIDVRTEWVPIDGSSEAPGVRWRRNLLSPGEQAELYPPGEMGDNLNGLPATYKEVRLLGTAFDVAGTPHQVDERFGDLPEWRRLLHDAQESWVDPKPERRLAHALYEKFKKPLEELIKASKDQ